MEDALVDRAIRDRRAAIERADHLLSLLRRIEWHEQRANYEPECAWCSRFKSEGHATDCEVAAALRGGA